MTRYKYIIISIVIFLYFTSPAKLQAEKSGKIIGWGRQVVGCDMSVGFVVVSAGSIHSLGLKADGSVVAWGFNGQGRCNIPYPNEGFVSVAAGASHSLGLKADGSIVAWGDGGYGKCHPPDPNSGFVAIAAGHNHSIGLKADGSIVAWGSNGFRQCNIPSPNSGFVAIAADYTYSLGLKIIFGDISGDGDVDFEDIKEFTERWLDTGCVQPYGCEGTDLDNDTDVDFSDFAVFAQHFFEGATQ